MLKLPNVFSYSIICVHKIASVSVFLLPKEWGESMTVYEALSLMIGFATLVVLIVSNNRK